MRLRLREKMLLIPATVLALLVAADTLVVVPQFHRTYAQALDSRVLVIAQNLKFQMERLLQYGLTVNEVEGYNAQCREVLTQHPDLLYAAVVSPGGVVLFHSDPSRVGERLGGAVEGDAAWDTRTDDGTVRHMRAAIVDSAGQVQGHAVVGFPRELVTRPVLGLTLWMAVVAAVSCVMAMAALWGALSVLVVRPMSSLVSVIGRITDRGDLHERVPEAFRDEVGDLARSFNALLEGIERRDHRIHDQVRQISEARDRLEERVVERTAELTRTNESLRDEMRRRHEAEQQRERMQADLMDASRKAGMADVATSVLHNVGNVLNSINVAATLLKERIESCRLGSLDKALDLVREHRDDLGAFLADDPRGRQLGPYLDKLGRSLAAQQQELVEESMGLLTHIDHVKEIISVQQSMARVVGAVETFDLGKAIDDAVKINHASLRGHGVEVAQDVPRGITVESDRHKITQIMVNLVSNAQHAVVQRGHADPRITIAVTRHDAAVDVTVADNGVGITPENLPRLFRHGFTTRPNGHGFGLHASALAAQELGGGIAAHSDGPGRGATFTLHLPLIAPRKARCPQPAPTRSRLGFS